MLRKVIIYQMGKVASSSLRRALEPVPGIEVIHAHHLDAGYAAELNARKRALGWRTTIDPQAVRALAASLANQPELPVITLVREPVSRNLSAYFNNLHLIHGSKDAWRQLSHEELLDGFLNRYPHDIPVEWFDRELKPSMGVDAYAHAFPRTGALRLDTPRCRLLLMRHDLAQEQKCKQVEALLGLNGLVMAQDNLASDKPYSQVYRDFLTRVRLPTAYLERMLGSRYARHFYDDAERANLLRHWSATNRNPEFASD